MRAHISGKEMIKFETITAPSLSVRDFWARLGAKKGRNLLWFALPEQHRMAQKDPRSKKRSSFVWDPSRFVGSSQNFNTYTGLVCQGTGLPWLLF